MATSELDRRITLNIGGIRHETYKYVLKKIPATRLSRLTENFTNYDPILKEYYFDRRPDVFAQILNYYRTGKLHYPLNVCGAIFEEELEFWGLDANQVEPCCWMTYTLHRDAEETFAVIERLYNKILSDQELARMFGWEDDFLAGNMSSWKNIKMNGWQLLERPFSSKYATVWSWIGMFFVCLSTLTFCLSTQSSLIVPVLRNRTSLSDARQVAIYQEDIETEPFLFHIEIICNVWFAFELLARFLFASDRKAFVKNVLTIIEIVALVCTYVGMMLDGFSEDKINSNYVELFVGFVRILRLFRLAKHSTGLKMLVQTVISSAPELMLLVFVVVLAAVLFGALVYYAERMQYNPNNDFDSIPHGLWWAIVTLCKIGYGDMVPNTVFGMIVGSVCAMTGVLTLALPMPVIVRNFEMFYSHAQARARLPKEKRQVLAA